MNFVHKCLLGLVQWNQINDYIDMWHDPYVSTGLSLHTWLGFTWDEYKQWVRSGDDLSLDGIVRNGRDSQYINLVGYFHSLRSLGDGWVQGHSVGPNEWAIEHSFALLDFIYLEEGIIPVVGPIPTGGIGFNFKYLEYDISIDFYNNRRRVLNSDNDYQSDLECGEFISKLIVMF